MRTLVALLVSISLAHAGELHRAARTCDVDRMRQLLSQHPALNEPDENGMTPLQVAIDSRQRACVALLIDAGADSGRTTPAQPGGPMPWTLEHSVMRRQTDVTKMLLAMGVDPNKPGPTGTVPLSDAALKGDPDAVRALLAAGARPNALNQSGTQPIHDAALGNNAEVIRELVKHGAELSARTRDEAQTPLHIAATTGKMKAVEALVALGADLTAKDARGQTPLDAAGRVGLADVAAFLKNAAAAR